MLEVRINFSDTLVAQGAQAIVVPTMDVAHWGERQHLLGGRIAQFALLNMAFLSPPSN